MRCSSSTIATGVLESRRSHRSRLSLQQLGNRPVDPQARDPVLLQPVVQRGGPPRSLSRISVARLSLWISIRAISLRADWPLIVSSSERRPWSTCAR